MRGEFSGDAPDRVVLMALADCGGNVSAAWRRLSTLGWQAQSLSTFRRRVKELAAKHCACDPADRAGLVAAPRPIGGGQPFEGRRGDVIVVAIDLCDCDVIRSWLIPNPPRHGSSLAAKVRDALALRSRLMLDLSEFAAHREDAP